MAEETKTYLFGNEGSTVPAWLAMNNGNNGFFGNNAFGGGVLGFILGLLFGNGWGGFGGFGNNGFGGAAAGYLGNQINNDNNTDLVLNAINGTDADVRLLATTLNADVNEVKSALATLNTGLATLGSQVGMSSLQVVNAIQSGNAVLGRQLCECCCENRLLTTQQGYEAQIRTIEQTNQLGSQADRNTASITGAINALSVDMTKQFCDAKERDLQDKIDSLIAQNSTLRNQIDNANQTAQVAAMIAPINAKLVEIENKQPNTVPVQWPNLTAVNNTPYVGGIYSGFNGFGYGSVGTSYWG